MAADISTLVCFEALVKCFVLPVAKCLDAAQMTSACGNFWIWSEILPSIKRSSASKNCIHFVSIWEGGWVSSSRSAWLFLLGNCQRKVWVGAVPCFDLGNGAVRGVVVDNERMVYHVTLQEQRVQTFLDVVLDVVAGDDYCGLLVGFHRIIGFHSGPLQHSVAKYADPRPYCANSRQASVQAWCLLVHEQRLQWLLHLVGR